MKQQTSREISQITLGEIVEETFRKHAAYTLYGGNGFVVVCAQGEYAKEIEAMCASFLKEGDIQMETKLLQEEPEAHDSGSGL